MPFLFTMKKDSIVEGSSLLPFKVNVTDVKSSGTGIYITETNYKSHNKSENKC